MTQNDQMRNKDVGRVGNGGQFAPDRKPEADTGLTPTAETPVDRLRTAAAAAGAAREAAELQAHRLNAKLVDALIAERFPAAVTARFNRDYQGHEFELEELRDSADTLLWTQNDRLTNDIDDINAVAAQLGEYGDSYLGEEVESFTGQSVEFTVGTIGADDPEPAVAAINLDHPDLSQLTLEQKNTLQNELIAEVGIAVPIIDVNEASYRLFDELESPENDEQRALVGRVQTLVERLGSRDAVAKAVTETKAWGSLEPFVVEALTDKNLGTRAMVHQAVSELEGR